MLHTKYQSFRSRRFFNDFITLADVKHVTPGAGPLLVGHNLNILTKCQGSRPGGFCQEDFSLFPYIRLCKTCNS